MLGQREVLFFSTPSLVWAIPGRERVGKEVSEEGGRKCVSE